MEREVIPINISKREKRILELLLEQKNGIPLDLLTDLLHVSNRTIYRELSSLENELAKRQIKLIRGLDKNYRLAGNLNVLQELKENLEDSSKELSAQQRQSLLVIQLLQSEEELKMEALAVDLQVSVGTIQSDLQAIEEIFKGYKIGIQRKKAKGIKAVAEESNCRLIVSGLISSEINEYDFAQLLESFSKSNKKKEVIYNGNLFLRLLDEQILSRVYQVLKAFDQDYFKHVTDTQFQKLIIVLTFSIMRIKQGHSLDSSTNLTEEVMESSLSLDIAKSIFYSIQEQESIEINRTEICFLALQLQGLNVHIRREFFSEGYDTDLSFKVSELIRNVSYQMDWDFYQDESLYNDLLAHISAAVKRAMAPMPGDVTALLNRVQSQYYKLNQVVEKNLKTIFTDIEFLSNEVIYVVLHFASTYEKLIDKQIISVLVICSSGVGMAKILQNRLQKNIPEINKIEIARISQLNQLNLEEYDLILSTIFLQGFESEYKVVTPLLMNDEIKSIHLSVKQLATKKLKKQPSHLASLTEGVTVTEGGKFDLFYDKLTIIRQLINRFDLKYCLPYPNLEELIQSICLELKDKVLSNPVKIKVKLLERMKIAPIGLPRTNMALFHCIDSDIQEPYFAIYEIPQSFEINSIDKGIIKMKRVLMMLGPEPLSEEAQEILGMISSSIVESDMHLELFNSGSKEAIEAFLNTLFLEKYKK